MGEHSILSVGDLTKSETLEPLQKGDVPAGEGCSNHAPYSLSSVIDIENVVGDHLDNEEEPLIQTVECRICQEEDTVQNLETPCACSGSLKYAHRKCVQHWCNEKGDTICEICHKPYQPGYTAPTPRPEDATIDIAGGWTISGAPLDLHDPRLLAMAAAERHLLEAEYDEYADTNANGAAFCRSAALILMALLLLRHALSLGDNDEDDASAFFSIFLLRAVGFLLPCYIMAWAISILQQRRQRQEAAEVLAASEVAYMIQAGQRRGMHITIAAPPGPATVAASGSPLAGQTSSTTTQQEPV